MATPPPKKKDRQDQIGRQYKPSYQTFAKIHLCTWLRDPARSCDLASQILHKFMQRTCKTIRYVALVVSRKVCIAIWSSDHSSTIFLCKLTQRTCEPHYKGALYSAL
jgi:hypothetical protein